MSRPPKTITLKVYELSTEELRRCWKIANKQDMETLSRFFFSWYISKRNGEGGFGEYRLRAHLIRLVAIDCYEDAKEG